MTRTVVAIALVNLRRLVRDRVALFFLFVFPVVLILLLGVSFGGDFTPRLGVVAGHAGRLGSQLVSRLESKPSLEVTAYSSANELADAVERGSADAGVVIPAGYDSGLRAGETSAVSYVARPGDVASAVKADVDSAVSLQAQRVAAARFAAGKGGGSFGSSLKRAGAVASRLSGLGVQSSIAGGGAAPVTGRFDIGAATQLVLFVFINSLAGSVALVQSRRLGLTRRMLAAPVTARSILLGEATGRWLVAMLQGVFIVVIAALLFGVRWGDPLGAGAIVIAFALVSTGAAMLFGAVLSNESQAAALTPLGLALAALGGCMVPLEVFSPTMSAIAHVTPHAWAVEGLTKLIRDHASLVQVLPQVGVLVAFAAVLLGLAARLLRRSLTA